MRFRATIDNVPIFSKIVQALEKIQRNCIIKFNETEMMIICNSDSNEGGIQVWSTVQVASLFSDYRVQSNANNEITLNLSSEALLKVLRSVSSDAEEVSFKLAKKQDVAVLTFQITEHTATGVGVRVTHDVRIEVLKPNDVAKLVQPSCPDPDVHIVLPPLAKMRIIVDRLRCLSDVLHIQANNKGILKASIQTDDVKAETTWTKCINPQMAKEEGEEEDAEERDPNKLAGIVVPLRGFLKFLNSHVISNCTIACICDTFCLILYVYIGEVNDRGGVLTFYIPNIGDDD